MAGPREESFSLMLSDGVAAYEGFHAAITDPAAIAVVRELRGGEGALTAIESLPPPDASIPLRVLASIGHHARAGALEFHHALEQTDVRLRDLPAWQDHHHEQLRRYVPEAFSAEVLWPTWEPPRVRRVFDPDRLELDDLHAAVQRFLVASSAPFTALGVAFILLRDWFVDVVPLLLKVDGVEVDALIARAQELASEGTPRYPSVDWPTLMAYEEEARERFRMPTSAWTVAHACARAGALELLDAKLTRERLDEALPPMLPPGEDLTAEPSDEAPDGGFRPSTAVSTDVWTIQDKLQYDIYAEAIAEFILDRRTRAPLTIGIKAPWGAGKTSLMRMVRRRLDRTADGSKPPARAEERRLTNREALEKTAQPREEAAAELAIAQVDTRPERTTVWFNAWKYQSGEQLWAGLAHAIVSQVEERMTAWERERFWASLNIRRIDLTAVRRRIYRAFLLRAIPDLLLLPLALLIALATALAASAAAGGLVAAGSALAIGADAVRRWAGFARESVASSAPQLVADPGYEDRLGFLHLVHDDMHRILALVASPERPLVVFVDDLDRCSYTTVVQVIEGLNAFLAGDFENCIFVIAMEPDLVAAQIHVAYGDLFDRIAARDGTAGSDLAWRFLEKMVQLPLALPAPGEQQIERYVGSLLAAAEDADGGRAGGVERDEAGLRAARSALQEAREGDSLDGIKDAFERASATLGPPESGSEAYRRALLRRAARLEYAREFDDSHPQVRAMLQQHARALNHNPREIKRFVNVFRFYAYVQIWRATEGLPAPDLAGAAKLATLAVRCPHLLSALGATVQIDDEALPLLAWLEHAYRYPERRAELLARVPGYVGDALGRPGMWTLIAAEPAVGELSSGFL